MEQQEVSIERWYSREATYRPQRGGRRTVQLSTYSVYLDGVFVGHVYQDVVSRDKRIPGARYVLSRYEAVAWRWKDASGHQLWRVSYPTRKEAIRWLLEGLDA